MSTLKNGANDSLPAQLEITTPHLCDSEFPQGFPDTPIISLMHMRGMRSRILRQDTVSNLRRSFFYTCTLATYQTCTVDHGCTAGVAAVRSKNNLHNSGSLNLCDVISQEGNKSFGCKRDESSKPEKSDSDHELEPMTSKKQRGGCRERVLGF